MFRKVPVMLALAAAIALPIATTAEAAMAVDSLGKAQTQMNPVEKTQFYWGGYDYCWYDDGWNGPGWYWCGYAWRSGFGWGGAWGWHGWRWAGGWRRHWGDERWRRHWGDDGGRRYWSESRVYSGGAIRHYYPNARMGGPHMSGMAGMHGAHRVH